MNSTPRPSAFAKATADRSGTPLKRGLSVCFLEVPARAGWRAAPGCGGFFAIILLSLLGLLSACSHYRLGTGATPAFQSLYIAPVENHTLLPQSQALLSTQLRESFARDGRVRLVNSREAADATLAVVINDYHRDVAAARTDDTGLARKFNVTLGVLCTLSDRRSGKVLFDRRPASVQREVFTDSGQLQAEYQTLPLMAEALAGKVVHATLDVW